MEADDQIKLFSWSTTKNFSQGSCSTKSTPDLASGGLSPDAEKDWNAYYSSAPSPGSVDGRLSDEVKAWNPFFNSPPRAGDGEMLSDEMKAWYPYNKDPCFVFTAGSGGGGKRVDDTPFVPERGFYQPSTEETWEAYQALATLVQAQQRANLPQAVLLGVADEVLSVLKSTILPTPMAKKAEIERILDHMPDHLFSELVSTAELIKDYYVGSPVSKTDERVALFVPERDFYQPKSEVTGTAYNLLLDVIKTQLQAPQSQTVECVIAHEILVILKKRDLENSKKKQMIEESFLDEMPCDYFETLMFAADLIGDFDDFSYSGIPAIGANDMARNVYIGSQSPPKRSRRMVPGFEFGFGDARSNSDQMDMEEAPMEGYDEEVKLVLYSDDEEQENCQSDEDIDACGSSQETSITAGVRDLSISIPVHDARDADICGEDTHITTGVCELLLNSPKLEYSSEEELLYQEAAKLEGSDKEDSDGWVEIDYE